MSSINTGASIQYGWESVKKHFWFFVGVAFVAAVIGSIGSKTKDSTGMNALGFLASTWMTCGTTMIYLQYRRGEKPQFATLFTTLDPYLRVLGASLLVTLIIIGGFILLIIPGIYWALKYQFTVALIIDKKMGVFDAMRRSGELTNGKKMELFMFDLMLLGVIFLGVLALGVGVLVAIPVVGLAEIDLYRKLINEKGVTTPAAPAPAKAYKDSTTAR